MVSIFPNLEIKYLRKKKFLLCVACLCSDCSPWNLRGVATPSNQIERFGGIAAALPDSAGSPGIVRAFVTSIQKLG